MIKKIITFFVLFFIIFDFVNACKFESEISQCNSALKNFIGEKAGETFFISPGSSIKSIEDFICLQDTREKRLFQISLDMNFKEIDEEMDKFLFDLEKNKGMFFSAGGSNYIDGVNYIWEKSDYFEEKYLDSCASNVVVDALECTDSKAYLQGITNYEIYQDEESVGNVNAINYLKGTTGTCKQLVDIKVGIFNNVTFNTLLLNKQKVLENNKKMYDIEQRSNYNNLIEIMMINLGYIERIWKKWPSKIKNAL